MVFKSPAIKAYLDKNLNVISKPKHEAEVNSVKL